MLLISYATSIRWDFIEWKNRHQCKEISTENDRMRWNKLENFIPEKNYENVILIKPYAQIIQKKIDSRQYQNFASWQKFTLNKNLFNFKKLLAATLKTMTKNARNFCLRDETRKRSNNSHNLATSIDSSNFLKIFPAAPLFVEEK